MPPKAILGALTVTRCQPARGHGCPAVVKFLWTIDGWNDHTIPVVDEFNLYSRSVSSEEAGVRGDGSWELVFSAFHANQPDRAVAVDLNVPSEFVGDELTDRVCSDVLVRTRSPSTELLRVSGDTYGSFCWPGDFRVADQFWTAKILMIEVTVTFPNRQFIAECAPVKADFQLGNFMRDAYLSGSCTDALLVSSDGKEIKLHRMVLAANSDAFKAMFEHDTEEKRTGICKITDIHHEPLKVFVDALYGFEIDDRLSELAELVFTAADKYQVQDLKRRCVEAMKKTLAIENSVERFAFAKSNDLSDLAGAVVEYVNDHYDGFVAKDRMDDMSKQPRTLRKEFFGQLRPKGEKKRSAEEAGL